MISAEQVYQMLGNDSLWSIAELCHRVLNDARVPYSICGGVAVCLHGYQRITAGIDELIAIRKLDGTFARFLHKSTQQTFRELVRNAMSSD